MKRIAAWAFAACIPMVAVAAETVGGPDLTAARIVENNVAARGGLEAWRKIESMVWLGHVERGNAHGARMSYVLEQKRPNKTRFELMADKQMSVRVYDGTNGWKMRPASGGRPELQPYTVEELNVAHDAQAIDGPLMDHAAKGIAVTLEGTDEIEGRKAYRLGLKLSSGVSQRVWIDAETFLEIKYDRSARNAMGQSGTVSVFYRDYRAIEGLLIPRTIETGAPTGEAMDKMVIDKIALNPPLEDRMFAKPGVPGARRNAVSVDARAKPANRLPVPPAR